MTLYTSGLLIPYLEPADQVSSVDDWALSAMGRLELLLKTIGQGGSTTITPSAAATDTFKTITWPASIAFVLNPAKVFPVVTLAESPSASGAVVWVKSGSVTSTGFDIGIRTVSGTSVRTVYWCLGFQV